MFVKTIVCFANSRKNGNRCIAGKSLERAGKGSWVRPVGPNAVQGLNPLHCGYPNGKLPDLLDVVDVPLNAHVPSGHQNENYVSEMGYFWVKTGHLSWNAVHDWLDTPTQIWTLGYSSCGMLNNRVPQGGASTGSLFLIKVDRLKLRLMPTLSLQGTLRHAVVGEFLYQGVFYRLHVTDPQVEAMCRNSSAQIMDMGQTMVCLSLGVAFKQYHYKLIAGVIDKGRFS